MTIRIQFYLSSNKETIWTWNFGSFSSMDSWLKHFREHVVLVGIEEVPAITHMQESLQHITGPLEQFESTPIMAGLDNRPTAE